MIGSASSGARGGAFVPLSRPTMPASPLYSVRLRFCPSPPLSSGSSRDEIWLARSPNPHRRRKCERPICCLGARGRRSDTSAATTCQTDKNDRLPTIYHLQLQAIPLTWAIVTQKSGSLITRAPRFSLASMEINDCLEGCKWHAEAEDGKDRRIPHRI